MQSLLFTFIAPPPERPGELVHRIIALLDVINFKLMCRIKSWYDQAHYRHKNVIIITIIIIIIIIIVVVVIIIIIIIILILIIIITYLQKYAAKMYKMKFVPNLASANKGYFENR